MMLSSGCRIYQQFRDPHHHHHHHHHHLLGFNTSLCNNNNNNMLTLFQVSSSSSSSSSLLIPSPPPPPPPSSKPRFFRLTNNNYNNKAASSSSYITDDFTGVSSFLTNTPRVSNSFSNSIAAEDAWDPPPQKLSPVAGGIVALGKFDALHIGHRELAIQAAKIGVPFLMSFVGMAEVLGWEPRAPIVAKCDRERVLSSWAPLCGNLTPKEFQVEFSKVRYLTPQQFVEKLSHELGVRGVVAGQNYRFGFKAAGDASDLLQLCNEYDMKAFIINSVMDKNQDLTNELSTNSNEKGQVSSTRVRHALAKGDMNYVSELLGRHHRLILEVKKDKMIFKDQKKFSAPRSCLLNLPPKEGIYTNCSLFIGDEIMAPCRVIIDTSDIHLELDDLAPHINISAQDFESLGVDFGESIL